LGKLFGTGFGMAILFAAAASINHAARVRQLWTEA